MLQLAIYGKGGIGKSTTISNVSAALAEKGLRVMQIGCDPKADSTILLRRGRELMPILDQVRQPGRKLSLDDMVMETESGVLCVEAGGPPPGLGCAGRGIIAALDKLKEMGAYDKYQPDVLCYDVLGDVVCGGFSMPMRKGYADKVFVLTSGENMAIHAAANIGVAVENFKGRGYAGLGGIILNERKVKNEKEKVEELARDLGCEIVASITNSPLVAEAEEIPASLVEAFPDSPEAENYRKLADRMIAICRGEGM